ncbi:MAG: hypothetical protein JKX80_00155 [Candidatus Pacebacteria bacterium]|nr:hypothetical protein [Candidatus Paceibacterota bacterium]
MASLLVAPFTAQADEMTPGQTTDWAEFKIVATDAKRLCVWQDRSLYCPRNRIAVTGESRRVIDQTIIRELQRLQRANHPAIVGQLYTR